VNRDILPERTWGAVNSQVPSKVFCGEGPQLAWGEESAKRSGRVCAAPQGDQHREVGLSEVGGRSLRVVRDGDVARLCRVR
jgi:hypothetical protein